MNTEDFIQRFRTFESSHSVEEFEAYGFQVWPVLRSWLGFQLVFGLKAEGERKPSGGGRFCRRFSAFLSMIGDSLRYRVLEHSSVPGLRGGDNSGAALDAVILTDSNRCFVREGSLFHYIADPVVRELERVGLKAEVWDLGKEGERHRLVEPVWLRRRFAAEIRRRLSLARISGEFSVWEKRAPAWFEPFGAWAGDLLGRPVKWEEVTARLRYVCLVARIFEEWLGKRRPRFLVVDCWYGLTTMGSILAASRLGIYSLDIQHGLQGNCDFAYSTWTKVPVGRYAALPDAFWVWGRENVRNVCQHNSPNFAGEGRAVVCGNLWINLCRYHADGALQQEIQDLKRLTAGYSHVFLVTLQPSQGVEEAVWPAIQNSPSDVFWFVRLHPRMNDLEKRRVEQMTQDMGERVNVSDASRVSLYALLQIVEIHLTGFSTCAHEALAFGKPTVLVHPSGLAFFREQVEQGVMIFEPKREEVCQAIEKARTILPEACLEVGNGFFASEAESLEGIRRMFRVESGD
ncbi:MAG TPA: hypothetical protein PLA90_01110 [Candidatus Sumerlaeota bacterium]|nr:hypothetical protein [Candidatus Sumerlaeota bacterium]